ncbi:MULTISPECIES: hypothetical protein [unclassified Sphingomonas]|uniref:hypothetical protein n=1 Tax=unclassified Sphingomonas TaxID=196159 RepID=UPI002269E36B|nr:MULTISPECIES: hypothetical protein [unclassified Sphingomonas]
MDRSAGLTVIGICLLMGGTLRTFEYFDARDREKPGRAESSLVQRPVKITTTPPAKRTIKPSDLDFSFAENAARYKVQVAASINDIMDTNRNCVDLDTDTLLSMSDRPSTNPSLQVACKDASGREFAVQFHAKDAASGVRATPMPEPITEDDAGRLCQRAVTIKLPNEPSVALGEAYFRSSPNGRASVSAQVDVDDRHYRAICRFIGRAITYVSVDLRPL